MMKRSLKRRIGGFLFLLSAAMFPLGSLTGCDRPFHEGDKIAAMAQEQSGKSLESRSMIRWHRGRW